MSVGLQEMPAPPPASLARRPAPPTQCHPRTPTSPACSSYTAATPLPPRCQLFAPGYGAARPPLLLPPSPAERYYNAYIIVLKVLVCLVLVCCVELAKIICARLITVRLEGWRQLMLL